VRFSYLFPIRNIRQEHSRSDHIVECRSSLLQRVVYVFETLDRLCVRIAGDNFAVNCSRSCACHVDIRAYPDRTRVTYYRLPRCSARDVNTFHLDLQFLPRYN